MLLALIATGALAIAGCGSNAPASAKPEPKPDTPALPFDASGCGTVTGLVSWTGPIPEVAPVAHTVPRADGTGVELRFVPLANAPRIDRVTRGVGGAIVFLRGVNPVLARPWDLDPVEVEFSDQKLVVKQGAYTGRTGFVRRGGSVTMRSREPVFQSLRGRGAAFFAFAFPDPDAPRTRTFDTCGRVELTSAAGFYWQSADLFVCDHPYYAVTASDGPDAGRFRFPNVPAGQYDLVVWHPNWVVARTERGPETVLPIRLQYAPPLESSRPITVACGRTALGNLTLP